MKLRIFIAIVCYSASASLFAQRGSFSLGANLGNYAMRYLKDFQQQYILYSSPVPMEAVVEFPMQPGYELAITLDGEKWRIGLAAWRHSTGGRVHYGDYSGFTLMDMVTTSNSAGFKVNRDVWAIDKLELYGLLQAGYVWNKLKITQEFEIFNAQAHSIHSSRFNATSITAIPGFGGRMPLTRRLSAILEFRYEIQIITNELEADDSGSKLKDFNGNTGGLEWNGFRAAAMIGYAF